jgi:hypothetical protein
MAAQKSARRKNGCLVIEVLLDVEFYAFRLADAMIRRMSAA